MADYIFPTKKRIKTYSKMDCQRVNMANAQTAAGTPFLYNSKQGNLRKPGIGTPVPNFLRTKLGTGQIGSFSTEDSASLTTESDTSNSSGFIVEVSDIVSVIGEEDSTSTNTAVLNTQEDSSTDSDCLESSYSSIELPRRQDPDVCENQPQLELYEISGEPHIRTNKPDAEHLSLAGNTGADMSVFCSSIIVGQHDRAIKVHQRPLDISPIKEKPQSNEANFQQSSMTNMQNVLEKTPLAKKSASNRAKRPHKLNKFRQSKLKKPRVSSSTLLFSPSENLPEGLDAYFPNLSNVRSDVEQSNDLRLYGLSKKDTASTDQTKVSSNQAQTTSNKVKTPSHKVKTSSDKIKSSSDMIKSSSDKLKASSKKVKPSDDKFKASSKKSLVVVYEDLESDDCMPSSVCMDDVLPGNEGSPQPISPALEDVPFPESPTHISSCVRQPEANSTIMNPVVNSSLKKPPHKDVKQKAKKAVSRNKQQIGLQQQTTDDIEHCKTIRKESSIKNVQEIRVIKGSKVYPLPLSKHKTTLQTASEKRNPKYSNKRLSKNKGTVPPCIIVSLPPLQKRAGKYLKYHKPQTESVNRNIPMDILLGNF